MKYDPNQPKHRLWLAQNILNLLPKWGFEIDESDEYKNAWEFVLTKRDKYDRFKKTVVFTSIEKRSGMMRQKGADAIRVLMIKSSICRYKKKVNRVGKIYDISSRMINAVKESQYAK